MKVTVLCLAILFLLPVSPWQRPPAAEAADEKLDAKIPKADPKKYESVRDAKEWANPYLIVRAEGIEVVSKGIAKGRKVITTQELRKALAALPVSAWPYGKVVAVQEIGIRSAQDEKPIKQNTKAVKNVLKGLEVEAEWWPAG
jgi:hypothetical protein